MNDGDNVYCFVRYRNLELKYIIKGSNTIWYDGNNLTAIQLMSREQYYVTRRSCRMHDLAFITEIQLIKPKVKVTN